MEEKELSIEIVTSLVVGIAWKYVPRSNPSSSKASANFSAVAMVAPKRFPQLVERCPTSNFNLKDHKEQN